MKRVPTFRPERVPMHKPKRSAADAEWKRLIESVAWRRYSASYRTRHPLCEWHLLTTGEPVAAVHVHHQLGQDVERMFDPRFHWALCKSCHSRVTLAERRGETVEYPARQEEPEPMHGYV